MTPDELFIEPLWQDALTGLARGDYRLLLGAGASAGATGGDSRPLPLGWSLAKEIVEDFVIDAEGEEIDLRTAYEVAEHRKDRLGRERWQYIRDRFARCSPSWHPVLTQTVWHRIYSLNIDDVIERTYGIRGEAARQRVSALDWSDPHSEPNHDSDELQVVHLHGYAPRLGSGGALVFSVLEYLQVTTGRHTWHRVFGDELLQRPFIIVGARLAEEFDLADVLRRGTNARAVTGRPSFVVLRSMTALQRDQFEGWGFIPVQADAGAFFEALAPQVQEMEARLAETTPAGDAGLLPRQARLFLDQFRWLRGDALPQDPPRHDFYGGDDPTWGDILLERDAPFEITEDVAEDFPKAAGNVTDPPQHVVCIWGPPGSGKSTALLRVGHIMQARGFDVYTFRGNERLNVDATLWWLERSVPTVLLFDGVADHADDLGYLAKNGAEHKINVLVVGAERERRRHRILEGIAPEFLGAGNRYRLERLSNREIDQLIDKLGSARRLGRITRTGRDARRRHFRDYADGQLLVALANLNPGAGFIERLKGEYDRDIADGELRAVYAMACMTYAFGYHLPLAVAAVAAGSTHDAIARSTRPGGALEGILRLESGGLKPRHRVLANMVIQNVVATDDVFRWSQDLCQSLAPYVNRNAIRRGTMEYRIIRTLMDAQVVMDWIGHHKARIWYSQLSEHYGWNSRFWEQRALIEAELRDFAVARSYAEEAVRIEEHPFTLNTLGTILLRMATEFFSPGSGEARAAFWEGTGSLRESRRRDRFGSEYPYVTFFTYALRFVEQLGDMSSEAGLVGEWEDWFGAAEALRVFEHPEERERLLGWQKRWREFL